MSHEMSSSPIGHEQPIRSPRWARALDEYGKRVWHEPTERERHGARVVGYLVAFLVNVILITVVRSIPSWGLPFVTPAFVEVIPVIERSLVATIVGNAILAAYDPAWFRHLARVVMNAFALNATIAVARVFPFDFGSPGSNDLARLMVGLVCVAVVIAIIVEVVQMLLALARRGPEFDE
jgi:hypothetical protein